MCIGVRPKTQMLTLNTSCLMVEKVYHTILVWFFLMSVLNLSRCDFFFCVSFLHILSMMSFPTFLHSLFLKSLRKYLLTKPLFLTSVELFSEMAAYSTDTCLKPFCRWLHVSFVPVAHAEIGVLSLLRWLQLLFQS